RLERSLSLPPLALPTPSFPQLRRSVEALSAAASSRTPPGLDEYVKEWTRHLAGGASVPGHRTLEALCWHATTACSPEFQAALARHEVPLGGRAIEGLVRSCHARWTEALASGAVATARGLLEGFHGRRRRLLQWQKQINGMLRDSGPTLVGRWLAGQSANPSTASNDLGAEQTSEWFQLVMHAACQCCRSGENRI